MIGCIFRCVICVRLDWVWLIVILVWNKLLKILLCLWFVIVKENCYLFFYLENIGVIKYRCSKLF